MAAIRRSIGRLISVDSGWLFVVGVGRSGTSLIQSMLASHSAIAFLPETGMLRRLVFSGAIDERRRRDGMDGALRLLRADTRLTRLRVDIEVALSRVADGPWRGTGLRLFEEIVEWERKSTSSVWVGDKDPRLVEYLPVLRAAWPGAYVVHVTRDPRDVLASRRAAAWAKGRNTGREALACRAQLLAGRRHGADFGERYMEVRYEELLADPQGVLMATCGVLGLAFEDGMLHFGAAAAALTAPDEVEWKRETLGPLLSTNAGRWRERLSLQDAALMEETCGTATGAPIDMTGATLPRALRAWVKVYASLIRAGERCYSAMHWLRVRQACRRVREAWRP